MKKVAYYLVLAIVATSGLMYLQGCGKGNAPVIISIKGATK